MKQRMTEISKAIFWVLLAILIHLMALVLGAVIVMAVFMARDIASGILTISSMGDILYDGVSMEVSDAFLNRYAYGASSYGTLLAVPLVLLGLWVLCKVQRKRLGTTLHARKFPAAKTALGFVMGFFVYVTVACIVAYTFINDLSPETSETIEGMFAETPFWILVCSTAIGAPLIEEFTFRGFVYEKLQGAIAADEKRSAVIAIVLQALLFGAFHLNLQQFVYASVLGLLFGLLRYQSDSVWPGVFAHIGFNFFSVALSEIVEMKDSWPFAEALAKASDWVMLAMTLPVFIVAFILFESLCKKEKRRGTTSQIPENLL